MGKKKKLEPKPFNKWTHAELYHELVRIRDTARMPRYTYGYRIANLSVWVLRNEILTLVGTTEDGHDAYMIDDIKCLELDDERLELLYKLGTRKTNSKGQKGIYVVNYLTKTIPLEDVEERVEVDGHLNFTGKDGKRHNINETHCRVVEVIQYGHTYKYDDTRPIYPDKIKLPPYET